MSCSKLIQDAIAIAATVGFREQKETTYYSCDDAQHYQETNWFVARETHHNLGNPQQQ